MSDLLEEDDPLPDGGSHHGKVKTEGGLIFLTDFADAAVTMPLALLVALFLLVRARRRDAVIWIATIAASFATILALKVAFGFFPALGAAIGVVSPSGHTAAATVVYAGLVELLTRNRWAAAAASVVIAIATALSRLAIDAHTVGEVVIGGVAGLGFAALLIRALPASALRGARDRAALLVLAGLVIAALHGRHAPFELILQTLEYRSSVGADPF